MITTGGTLTTGRTAGRRSSGDRARQVPFVSPDEIPAGDATWRPSPASFGEAFHVSDIGSARPAGRTIAALAASMTGNFMTGNKGRQ